MTLIKSVTDANYNIQIKDVIFTKIYVEKLFDSIHKNIVNQLFNAAHREIQTHELIFKIYQDVFNFKFILKAVKNEIIVKLRAVFDSRIVVKDFSNFFLQLCFDILMYCDSINRTLSINIELAKLLTLFVLHAHFSQMSSIVLSFHLFISSSTISLIRDAISFTSAFSTFDYFFFVSIAFAVASISSFKNANFEMFRFRVHFERRFINIMFIEIFEYQITKDKNLKICTYKDLNFQLLIGRLISKKFFMQSNMQKIIYDIKNNRFVFDDDDDLQTLLKF